MLKMVDRDSGRTPLILCDGCGKHIADARRARCLWPADEQMIPGRGFPYIVHIACQRPFERVPRHGARLNWMRLDQFIAQVAVNAGIDLEVIVDEWRE